MKITWNPALTLDGYIAKTDGNSDWVSEEDSAAFRNLILESGCVIVGRTTYEQYKGDVFPVPGATTFVVTTHPEDCEPEPDVEFINASPQDLVHQLEHRGFTRAVLAGGRSVNSEFVSANLVDEIIANIYPMTFGKGIQLLDNIDCELQLELQDVKQMKDGIVRHRYSVK